MSTSSSCATFHRWSHSDAMADKDRVASALRASETTIRRLLGQAAKRSRPKSIVPPVPFGTDIDPNREFSRAEPVAVWFLVFLLVFVLLYAIVEKMHVR